MKKIAINEEDRLKYVSILLTIVTEAEYSAYGVSTVLNLILDVNSRERVRSQMMYNYARNGMIVTGEKIFGVNLRTFTQIEVIDFLIRYCVRNNIDINAVNIQTAEPAEIETAEI